MLLKQIRKRKNINQAEIAKMIGVSRSTVSMWEIGASQPSNELLIKLSQILDTSVDELLGFESSPHKPSDDSQGIKIPMLGTVPAGIPLEAIEEVLDYEEITEDMARNGKYITLQIKGDSMLPTICNGDVVIVRLQPDVENGETAIVMVNGDDATCKKVVKHTSGITLVPNNPAYEPRYFTNEEISSTPVRILGKVVELRRKF